MGIDLQQLVNSRYAVGLALGIGRAVPPSLGEPFVKFAADRMASLRQTAIVQAVRANQWVISGEQLSAAKLDQATRAVFRHTGQSLYHFYHNLHDTAVLQQRVAFTPMAERLLARARAGRDAVVIVGVHLSNFDFIMRAAALQGLRALAIAMPRSAGTSGYEWQNEMRREAGIEILPASKLALRRGIDRLRQGGAVVTGIDRPLPGSNYRPSFFGRPAALPAMHILMALKAKAPVVVVGAVMQPDGVYKIDASDPIWMQSYPERHNEIVTNAESVLKVAESFIGQAPQQWAMFYPVWPEVVPQLPA
jgi:lauroyl/myristoyl acyltransferase